MGWMYLYDGNLDQARQYLKRALEAFDSVDDQFGPLQTLRMLGNVESQSGNLPEADRYYSMLYRRASRLGRPEYQMLGLYAPGVFAIMSANYDRAEELLLEYRHIARRRGMLGERCEATRLLGETAWFRGDVDTAERRLTEALGLARERGDRFQEALAHRWLSYVACAAGDFDRAEDLAKQSLEAFRDDETYGRGVATLALARVALFRGNPVRAVELFRQGLRCLPHNAGMWADEIRAVEGLSWALADAAAYQETARLLGFLGTERARGVFALPPVDRPHHQRALSITRAGLAEEAFSTAWDAGAALTVEQAVDLALESPS